MAIKSRVLKFLCINHANVIEHVDNGVDKNGDPTSSRSACEHILSKTTEVNGKRLPTFLLAEVPPVLHPDDSFDAKVLRDLSGALRAPYPEWMAERDLRLAEAKKKADEAAAVIDAVKAKDVVKGLAHIARKMGVDVDTLPVTAEAKTEVKADPKPARGKKEGEA